MSDTDVISEPIPLTDMGNAERFARQHGDKVRHVKTWGKSFCFNGRFWELDDTDRVYRLAKQVARSIYKEASFYTDRGEQKKVAQWAHASQSRAKLEAMVALAKSEEPIPARHNSFDTGTWLLNCDNCTFDLSSGQAKDHDAGDLITKSTHVEYPTAPGVNPVLWLQFLDKIFAGDTDLISFVQRLFGSALVGEQIEHLLVILHGGGANGKSVFMSTVQSAMGDYACTAAPSLLMRKKHESHPTELADLRGKRLAAFAETKDDQHLDDGLVKSITGGDRIKARFMHQDFFEFSPSHLPVIATNHKPKIQSTDYGTWRRVMMVPFDVTIPPNEQDKRLAEKLQAELPAILKWLIEGCLEWKNLGLNPPAKVLAATDQYRQEEDALRSFLDECCLIGTNYRIKASQIYTAYRKHCETEGEEYMSCRKFNAGMAERQFEKQKSGTNWFLGVTLNE